MVDPYKWKQTFLNSFNPDHSDFLIHWTGHDIDSKGWHTEIHSQTNKLENEKYLARLINILKHGLWLKPESSEARIKITDSEIVKRKSFSRICFSELKLRDIKRHTIKFGRLGIGFKRFYLFDRLGMPVLYYPNTRPNWLFPKYQGKTEFGENDFFSAFLKPMWINQKKRRGLRYEFFDESEWRIIYSEQISKFLTANNREDVNRKFISVENYGAADFRSYLAGIPKKKHPTYLLPVKDKWFAMIIYPSIALKVESQKHPEIRSLIQKSFSQSASTTFGPAGNEPQNEIIEVDLDSCKNF